MLFQLIKENWFSANRNSLLETTELCRKHVTKNSFSYLHNHIHWLNFTLKGHFMLAFPERMALLTFQNPKLYHIDIPQVCVCLCALVMAITALDCGFRCLMDSLSLRLSPSWLQQTEGGVQAQDHTHRSSRKEGQVERKKRMSWNWGMRCRNRCLCVNSNERCYGL